MKAPLFVQRRLNKNKPALRVYWWRPDSSKDAQYNFGDELTPDILRTIWGYQTVLSDPNSCELIATGSILDVFQNVKSLHTIKVWGSGFIKPGEANVNPNLDFYAVRGPLTADRIKVDRALTLADPGLLANLVYDSSSKNKHKVGVVTHYVDLDRPEIKHIQANPTYKIINPLQSPQQVITEITSCELIVSSSLHGLIIADSFKIPNYWMPLSDKVVGGDYKFKDYYGSTERSLVQVPPSALDNRIEVENLIRDYKPIKNLRKIQKDLVKAFPF